MQHVNGLMQRRCDCIVDALELCVLCNESSKFPGGGGGGGGFKNTYELLNLRALKYSLVNKI